MATAAQQHPDQQTSTRDHQLAEAIAAILAASVTATAAAAAVRRLLAPLNLAAAAINAAFRLALRFPRIYLPPTRSTGGAVNATRQQALQYRAWFLLNSAQRLGEAIRTRPADQTDRQALDNATAKERTYLAAHIRMQRRRLQAASDVDRLAAIHGDRLGWLTVIDDRTDAECLDAAFKDFLVSRPPAIGWPGTVHPHCRCRPTAPWGTQLLR